MRNYHLLSGIAYLTVSSASMAFNPVQGWYGGGIGLVSYAPSIDIVTIDPSQTNTQATGQLDYHVGGGGGGQIGYRCKPWRIEAEVVFNINGYSRLTVNGVTLNQENNATSSTSAITVKGNTNYLAGFINGYYDLYQIQFSRDSQIIPYVGIGAGYANINNQLRFYQGGVQPVKVNGETITSTFKESNGKGAVQFIIGAQYFGDDFTSVGFDYRYFTTIGKAGGADSGRYTVHTANIVLNFAFDSSST